VNGAQLEQSSHHFHTICLSSRIAVTCGQTIDWHSATISLVYRPIRSEFTIIMSYVICSRPTCLPLCQIQPAISAVGSIEPYIRPTHCADVCCIVYSSIIGLFCERSAVLEWWI